MEEGTYPLFLYYVWSLMMLIIFSNIEIRWYDILSTILRIYFPELCLSSNNSMRRFFNLIYLYINSILHQNILYLKHTCTKLHKETRTPWHNIPFNVTCILINIIHTVWTFTYFRHFLPFVDIVHNVSKMFFLLKLNFNNIRCICKNSLFEFGISIFSSYVSFSILYE